MARLGPVLALAPAALVMLACSDPPGSAPIAGSRSHIELDQNGKVFTTATALWKERSLSARLRESAALATGALLVPFVDAAGLPLLASNGTRIRGTCGATFVAPSYAVTAAHCVDGTKMDVQALVIEMYRPTAAIDPGSKRAASLTGAFPNFTHPALGSGDGYFVDRYDCKLVSRCSGLYGGPVNCDGAHSRPSGESDTALVRCDGAPGLKYGFVEIATVDDPAAEVFLPWKHEIYDIPPRAVTSTTDAGTDATADGAIPPVLDAAATPSVTDDRWLHYVVATASPVDNYHYFGKDPAGLEQNQLLPLISVAYPDGTLHHKLSATAFSVSTDLLGCHGTSGAGALQQGEQGRWQLLGPISGGNPEHNAYLCNHIPSLDGFSREPGTLGLSYMALDATQFVYAHNRAAIEADCNPFSSSSGVATIYTNLGCPIAGLGATAANAAFADELAAPRVSPDMDVLHGQVTVLTAGQTTALTGFAVQAGEHYRIGLSAWSNTGCQAPPCPRLSVGVDATEVLVHAFETAPGKPIPLGATFQADRTGIVTLSFRVDNGDQFELGGITLLPEAAVNSFDTMPERAGALLVDLATPSGPAQPMRFVGDGRAGFAGRLLADERMVIVRQAVPGGRRWTARFTVTPPTRLVCGLVDGSGQVVRQADCSSGLVQIDDTPSPAGARGGFFVQTPADGSATQIDDLRIVSDAAPDTDGDSVPDAVDTCPRGPLPLGEALVVNLPDATFFVCTPEPTTVVVPVPQIQNACEKATLVGRLSAVNGKLLGRSAPVVSATGTILLPLGSHTISWEIQDGAANIYATLTRTVTLFHDVGPRCCDREQILTMGSASDDVAALTDAPASCVLAQAGDDFVVTGGAADWLAGGPGGDYIVGGGGNDVLSGGDGDDYLTGGADGALTVYAGPGNDTVHARLAASARIFGGSGADILIGGNGPDEIYPGPGTIAVVGGSGDDTVTIYDVCELSPGMRLYGGDGYDRLLSPVPREILTAAGVLVEGFEDIVVDATLNYLSECFR